MLRYYFRFAVYLFVALWVSAASAGAYEDFFKAVRRDDADTMWRLLLRGFDPNSRDENGQNGLFLALREGSMKVAEVLMQHPQLAVDAANANDETPLMMAALKGRDDWLPRLVARGATIARDGWSPLHYAATGPSTDAVRWLLDHGAPLDGRSPNGSTPLMMAARYGPEPTVDLLLARGAEVRAHNERELNAGDFARLAGREALAARLDQLRAKAEAAAR